MDLVFPDSIPRREEITDHLDTFASRGECEPVTFCVRTLSEIRGLEVKAGELVREGGGRLEAPDVRIVRCAPRLFQGEAPLYEGGPIGVMDMPTYLEEARAVDAAAGTTLQYWLTVTVGEEARAGMYHGDVEIRQEGGGTYTVDLAVDVLPIVLVEPRVTLGFWDFAYQNYDGEIGTVGDVYATMRRHGMNAVFTMAGLFHYHPETDTHDFSEHLSVGDDGLVGIRWEGTPLAERMEAAKRAGFKAVCYSPAFGPFVGRAVRERVDKETLDRETSQELAELLSRYEGSEQYDVISKETTNVSEKYYPLFSESYARMYAQIVEEILKEAERRGWPRIVMDPGDETFSHHVHDRVSFPLVIRHLELMKCAGATTILNHVSPLMGAEYGEYARAALRFVDIGMPAPRLSPSHTAPYGGTMEKMVEAFGKLGIVTYTYNMTMPRTPDLAAARFNAGWFFETVGEGVRGEFDYVFFRVEGDPYNPLDSRYWNNEFLWFYPPREKENRLGGGAVSLEAKREGVDDLRYVQTLASLIERAEAREDSTDAERAAREAEATRKRILGSFDFSRIIEEGYPRSHWDTVAGARGAMPTVSGAFRLANGWTLEAYDRHRRDIADAIVQLQEALAE